MKSNGAVLWQGASLLDGAPIVVIATGLRDGSSNRKTGAMIQTYILRADVDPVTAVRTRTDASICGQCPHRGRPIPGQDHGMTGRTCYVNVGQGPLGVWRAWKRGRYASPTPWLRAKELQDLGRGRLVRLGTYGDPAAVPFPIWQHLTMHSEGNTGYTHQWRTAPLALRSLCMASADSEADAREAQAAGWRTFRVAMPCDTPRLENEAVCPASKEAGKKLTCAQCLACAGANGRRGSIVIQAHGGFAVMTHVNSRGVRGYFMR